MYLYSGLFLYLGAGLAVISMISLSIFLRANSHEFRDFINSKVKTARLHGILLLLTVSFVNVTGDLLFFSSGFIRLHLVTVLVLWAALMYIEVSTIHDLLRNGYYPSINRDFLDSIAYMAILWLIFEKINVSWMLIGLTSTAILILILYSVILVNRYLRISTRIIVPVDLYPSALGARAFSALIGLHMLAYGRWGVFRGFITVSFLVLALSMLYTARELRGLVKDFR